MKVAGLNDLVFINCPFDEQYNPMLQALVFGIYRCGFYPKTAMDEDDATQNRLSKIIRLIKDCRYGIHDLSRIESSMEGFPRFNMPFELGIFFGAKYLGDKTQKLKNALIFEHSKFSYQKYISDLNGIDPKAHNNDPQIAIQKISDWLKTASGRKTIPGHTVLLHDFIQFRNELPSIIERLGFTVANIPFTTYRTIVEEVVLKKSR